MWQHLLIVTFRSFEKIKVYLLFPYAVNCIFVKQHFDGISKTNIAVPLRESTTSNILVLPGLQFNLTQLAITQSIDITRVKIYLCTHYQHIRTSNLPLQKAQNITYLEDRVDVLEVEMAILEVEVDDVESDLSIQTDKVDEVEDDISQNTNNINGTDYTVYS